MSLSFDEFRAGLPHARRREALGLALSDDEAQRVVADPQSAQTWYSYWLSIGAPDAWSATVPLAAPIAMQGTPPGTFAPAGAGDHALPAAPPASRPRTGLWVALAALGVLLLAGSALVVFAFVSARHWTKVDVPATPETFHSETYQTGLYDVAMDSVNPCWVNEDWTDCTNSMAVQYQAACTGVQLTTSATAICADYSSAIDQMKAQDQDGYYVVSLGTYGHLTKTPETATRQVSNNDARPAVTHRAVCYLGFLGECR